MDDGRDVNGFLTCVEVEEPSGGVIVISISGAITAGLILWPFLEGFVEALLRAG